MATVFVANLGARDVVVDGQKLEQPRQDGERLLKQWPEVASRLTLPILEPTLQHLRERGLMPDRIVLVATDQPESVATAHRSRDTVHFGEVAKLALARRFQLGADRLFTRPIRHENPALYDEMHQFFRRLLGSPRDRAFVGATRCYVLPVGGTPAANAGLLHAAVEQFGAGCVALYLREGTTRPVELNVGATLQRALLRQVALGHLETYQFAAARSVLRQMELPDGGYAEALVEHCQRRLNFDFAGAARVLEAAWARSRPEERAFLDEAVGEAEALDGATDSRALLVELARNMRVVYQNGAYLDYLTRLVRFEESAARLIVRECLPPLDYSENDRGAQATRRELIGQEPDLLAYLQAVEVDGRPLRYEESNTTTLLALVDYVVAERPSRPERWRLPPERRAALRQARDVLRCMWRALNPMRHASVHRFGGTSAEEIAGAYASEAGEGRKLEDDVRLVVEVTAGGMQGEWLIDRARAKLREMLRRAV